MAHNIPMQGGGFYSTNSGLQHEAMKKALPLIERAIVRTLTRDASLSSKGLTAIEYGCSDGNNSYVFLLRENVPFSHKLSLY